jgi:hypothetical protein
VKRRTIVKRLNRLTRKRRIADKNSRGSHNRWTNEARGIGLRPYLFAKWLDLSNTLVLVSYQWGAYV